MMNIMNLPKSVAWNKWFFIICMMERETLNRIFTPLIMNKSHTFKEVYIQYKVLILK